MNFFKSKLFIVLAIVTVIIVAFMILSAAFGFGTGPVSNGLNIITTPVQNGIYGIGKGISSFFEGIGKSGQYKGLYDESQKRVTELEAEVREIDTLKNENDRLRALLDFEEREKDKKLVAAQVAASSPDNWYAEIQLNKGTNSGIRKDNVVYTDNGLVGYVTEVGPTWCKVLTVLDINASVGCVVPRSGDTAVAEGDAELAQNSECSMNYISKDATVIVGDSVETSGLGSIYPAGILIGKISSITPELQGLYNKATIKTSVDFKSLREVVVIVG
ncbi:MAG: rod shape-determining protein MreC [Clostridia bacterium]|nr:rod shape-determining protein MreC [Clostridia bacterium]